ncbi:MAG: UDP-N-acetylmuramate dehydrogenase [Minisyncoccia bacterium]
MEIQQHVPLKQYSTFKTGGLARLFCVVSNREELTEALLFADKEKVPFYVLGGVSNMLVSEKGFDGLIIKIATQGIEFEDVDTNSTLMKVEAGVLWDECVQVAVEYSLYGLENLSLIPGTVGAAPIQNIGAYGVEVGDIVHSVEVFNIETRSFETLPKEKCQFGYRDSLFKKREGKKYIVLGVNFLLSKNGVLKTDYKDVLEYFNTSGTAVTLHALRNAIIDIRTKKLPDLSVFGTAGSFFKNPVVKKEVIDSLQKDYPLIPVYEIDVPGYVKTSAAFLIDKVAGMKGVRVGDVGTYENQALVLVNYGNATGEDVFAFAQKIQSEVKEKSGIDLEMEVQTLGF